jgi:hypothetical protein
VKAENHFVDDMSDSAPAPVAAPAKAATTMECKITSIAGGIVKVDAGDKGVVACPDTDILSVVWRDASPDDTQFTVVNNKAFTEGKTVTVYFSASGEASLHPAQRRRPQGKRDGDRRGGDRERKPRAE